MKGRLFVVVCSATLFCPVWADEFRIEFNWYPDMKACFSEESPEIKLFDVPQGTTELRVKMVDKDAPRFKHGGGKVAYEGGASIPQGALKKWKGPCPPDGTHTYLFKVEARAGKKKAGKAEFEQKYPPQ